MVAYLVVRRAIRETVDARTAVGIFGAVDHLLLAVGQHALEGVRAILIRDARYARNWRRISDKCVCGGRGVCVGDSK